MSCRLASGILPPPILRFPKDDRVPDVTILWNSKSYMAHANYQILGSQISVAVDKNQEDGFITAGDHDQVA